jgi:hypothetical protein
MIKVHIVWDDGSESFMYGSEVNVNAARNSFVIVGPEADWDLGDDDKANSLPLLGQFTATVYLDGTQVAKYDIDTEGAKKAAA